MKLSILASLVLIGTNAQAATLCGVFNQDPDGFSVAISGGMTAHIGQHTFLSARGSDRDLILVSSKSGTPLCISASVKALDARNVLVHGIELAQALPRR